MEDDITEIASSDIEMALQKMKNLKATGPDFLPVEVWKSLGRTGVNFLNEALTKITDKEKISYIRRKRILILIFKNKGDIVNCGNYIKLMCHSMKLCERVHENRLRNIVSISEEQFGFMKKIHNCCYFCSKAAARKIQEQVNPLQWKLASTKDPLSTLSCLPSWWIH